MLSFRRLAVTTAAVAALAVPTAAQARPDVAPASQPTPPVGGKRRVGRGLSKPSRPRRAAPPAQAAPSPTPHRQDQLHHARLGFHTGM